MSNSYKFAYVLLNTPEETFTALEALGNNPDWEAIEIADVIVFHRNADIVIFNTNDLESLRIAGPYAELAIKMLLNKGKLFRGDTSEVFLEWVAGDIDVTDPDDIKRISSALEAEPTEEDIERKKAWKKLNWTSEEN